MSVSARGYSFNRIQDAETSHVILSVSGGCHQKPMQKETQCLGPARFWAAHQSAEDKGSEAPDNGDGV